MLLYHWLIISIKLVSELSYTVIAIDFASRYCISCENSASTCHNLKMDTHLVGIAI